MTTTLTRTMSGDRISLGRDVSAERTMTTSLSRDACFSYARHGHVVVSVELFNSQNVQMATGLLHLYRAPFSPSIVYENGAEHFVLRRGWGVLRTRLGLLAWLELSADSLLQEAATDSSPLASGATRSLKLASWSIRFARHATIIQNLQYSPESEAAKALQRTCEMTVLGTCVVDAPVRIPCEDVVLCIPSGSSVGLWIKLGSPGGEFDEILKGWLGACSVQI